MLAGYIYKKIFFYTFSISTAMALMLSLIECVERSMRSGSMTLFNTVAFVTLNLIPAFLENISTCSWLATCMLLKDMNQENELQVLDIIGFEKKKLVKILLFSGLLVSLLVLGVKEWVGDGLTSKVERFRREKIKNINFNKIKNRWITADKNIKLHFDFWDLSKNMLKK